MAVEKDPEELESLLGGEPLGEGEKEEPREPSSPSGLTAEIRERLLAGASQDELVAEGYNKNSVRTVASELKTMVKGKDKLPARRNGAAQGQLQIFARGSPPEALVDSLTVPVELNGSFQRGMKFGMLSIISGVRIAQELSQIGVQQARPLVEMAKDMRTGEAAAAKAASLEAAMAVGQSLEPRLSALDARLETMGKVSGGANPMQGMMVRIMEPMMESMMSRIMPGTPPMGSGGPAGWERKSE